MTDTATGHRGFFVTLDGPGGAGKSTTTRYLHRRLTNQGYIVHPTTEPSNGQLGTIARHGADTYFGHTLACLIAADRYHHLATEIRPHLATGRIVLCDRYVASSYVLQRMDDVPIDFIEVLNARADIPDLAVILAADPTTTSARIDARGTRHRFETGLETSTREAELYADAVTRLAALGYPLLTIDTTNARPEHVAERIATRIAELLGSPTTGPASA